ncbi:MAG: S8 family serine peptidase, partial [Deltaproteobacteria bacterium]|nr:S8 family serine peptidase [Deltaproteobacteria bacterium]
GSTDIVVGVVDTGVAYNHPDLAANMWVNPAETVNGIDDDGNGVIDDVHGYDALANNGDPNDQNGHGTHCAGPIGGVGNDGVGVVGVNWRTKIMALRFLGANGSGTVEDAIKAIAYAVSMKQRGVNLRVLSNSWGGSGASQALEDAVQNANNNGILFVAAAGNSASDNDDLPTYPAAIDLPNVVTVAAVDREGNLASFSNFGYQSVHVAAPGVSIVSTYLNGSYSTLNGTSMATPHVAGVAALVLSHDASLSPAQLKSRLMTTAKPLTSLYGLVAAPGIVSALNASNNTLTPLPPVSNRASYRQVPMNIAFDSSIGTRVMAVDDGYALLNLGFEFPFYKRNFSRVAISANGRIVPLSESEGLPTDSDYVNKMAQGILPFHDDLYPATEASQGGVWVKNDGNVVTITWNGYAYGTHQIPGANTLLQVQAKLFRTGRIEFHFQDTFAGDSHFDYGASASIGLAPTQGVFGEKLTVTSNAADEAEVGSGRAIAFESEGESAANDFDGDGRSDIVTFRPTIGGWFVLLSSTGFNPGAPFVLAHGKRGDTANTGDFDGDGIADFAIFRPSTGFWYLRMSSTGYGSVKQVKWGRKGDKAMVGDFDGDFVSDIAFYRPRERKFYALRSSEGLRAPVAKSQRRRLSFEVRGGGGTRDVPLHGDFTGQRRESFVSVAPSSGSWKVRDVSNRTVLEGGWGGAGDIPLVCDFDGNGRSDRVAARAEADGSLSWHIATDSGNVQQASFGRFGDTPSCARDFDGDGKVDLSVFRPASAEWFVRESGTGEERRYQFGLPGDVPL